MHPPPPPPARDDLRLSNTTAILQIMQICMIRILSSSHYVTAFTLLLHCEQSLFSQSSLSSAGLERAKWPRGKLERGASSPPSPNSFPSASCFLLSLASLDFLARVTILRDCSQSTLLRISLNFIRLLRVVITPSVTSLLREENDSKQSDEIQAIFVFAFNIF